LPPRSRRRYHAFTEASARRHDAFTLAIGPLDGEPFICDAIRCRFAPFDPPVVAREYADLARSYGVKKIIGDAFAGEWVASAFRNCGIRCETSPRARSIAARSPSPTTNACCASCAR
jgi:hypothetical protein